MRLAVALVVDGDGDAAVQEGELAQALRQRVEAVLGGLEDLRIGLEGDLGAALLGRAGDFQRLDRIAAVIALLVDLAVAPDFQVERLRQRVHHRDADAVQTAGDLVAVVVELAAGVQHGHHDLSGRAPALVLIHGDAAAVVDDGHRVVDVDRDVDLIAVAGQRLVDRVVDDLVDQVMQARRTGRADVHRRPLAHGLEPFENLDFVGAVLLATHRDRCHCRTELPPDRSVRDSDSLRGQPAAVRRSVVRVVTLSVLLPCACEPVVLPMLVGGAAHTPGARGGPAAPEHDGRGRPSSW